jgi:hypothetical protein
MLTRALSEQEIWAVQTKWRKVFGRRLHGQTGRWTLGRNSDLDLFSRKYMRKYLTGAAAESAYADADAGTLYVISDDGKRAELHDCADGSKPRLDEFDGTESVLIFPAELAWTVAVGIDYSDRLCFTLSEWVDDDA